MLVSIYNVQHGFSAFVRTPNRRLIVIGAGHDSFGWTPSLQFLREGHARINRLVIDNFDQDHMDDLVSLIALNPEEYVVNQTIRSSDLRYAKSVSGSITRDAAAAIDLLERLEHGYRTPPKDWGGVGIFHFYNLYPVDFGYNKLNELSVVTFVHFNGVRIIFPGDLEKAGWKKLLSNPTFLAHLRLVNVFVASHHGRANGCCADVFDVCHPEIVIVSDSEKQFDSQETTDWYARRTTGVLFGNQIRYVLTTRTDGAVHIECGPDGRNWIRTEGPIMQRAA